MTLKKLGKIKRRIAECKRNASNLRHGDLEAIALALGRKLVKRGKEPTYESTLLDEVPAISIPNHAGQSISIGVARQLLDYFEQDVFWLEAKLEEEKDKGAINEDEHIH